MKNSAKVFQDDVSHRVWRVEWEDDDGGVEVTIFGGPNARDRALLYANCRYPGFEQIRAQRT